MKKKIEVEEGKEKEGKEEEEEKEEEGEDEEGGEQQHLENNNFLFQCQAYYRRQGYVTK